MSAPSREIIHFTDQLQPSIVVALVIYERRSGRNDDPYRPQLLNTGITRALSFETAVPHPTVWDTVQYTVPHPPTLAVWTHERDVPNLQADRWQSSCKRDVQIQKAKARDQSSEPHNQLRHHGRCLEPVTWSYCVLRTLTASRAAALPIENPVSRQSQATYCKSQLPANPWF